MISIGKGSYSTGITIDLASDILVSSERTLNVRPTTVAESLVPTGDMTVKATDTELGDKFVTEAVSSGTRTTIAVSEAAVVNSTLSRQVFGKSLVMLKKKSCVVMTRRERGEYFNLVVDSWSTHIGKGLLRKVSFYAVLLDFPMIRISSNSGAKQLEI